MGGKMTKRWLLLLCLPLIQIPANGNKDFMDHVGANGTQLGRLQNDPNYYTSHSRLPHLPRLDGFMGSHGKPKNTILIKRDKKRE